MYSWLVTRFEFTACWALGHWNTRPSAPFLQQMENYLKDKKKKKKKTALCSAFLWKYFGLFVICF